MNESIVLRFTSVDLSQISQALDVKITTNLCFVNVICNVVLVLGLRNIGPPPRHQFYIFEVPFFAFKFEVSANSDEESI